MCAPVRRLSHLLILSADQLTCRYQQHIAPVIAPNNVLDDGRNDLRLLLYWCLAAKPPLMSHLPGTDHPGRRIVWHIICKCVSGAARGIGWGFVGEIGSDTCIATFTASTHHVWSGLRHGSILPSGRYDVHVHQMLGRVQPWWQGLIRFNKSGRFQN